MTSILQCPHWLDGRCTRGHVPGIVPVKVCSITCPEPDIQTKRAKIAAATGEILTPPGRCATCSE
jgi:hypothetical protein